MTFVSYHLMVGLGVAFMGLTLLACFLLWRGILFQQRWLMWVFVFAVLGAVVANQTGWVSAEVGRQPWIVHPPVPYDEAGNLVVGPDGFVQYDESLGLRTTEAVSKAISAEQVLGSIIMFVLIYGLLFAVWVMLLNEKIQKGPEPLPEAEPEAPEGFLGVAAARVTHEGSLTGAGDRVEGG